MSKFKVGDQVVFNHGDDGLIPKGTTGVIKEVTLEQDITEIGVDFSPAIPCKHERGYWMVCPHELTKMSEMVKVSKNNFIKKSEYSPSALTNIPGAH